MEKNKKIGAVTSSSVKKFTKKNWDQWLTIMNENGAMNMTHQQIVALLKKKYKLSIWWQQEVAKGYQIAAGKRIAGQNLKGLYTLTLTKTIPCTASQLWKFLISKDGVRVWLKPMTDLQIKVGNQFEIEGGIFGEVRTIKAGTRIRLNWINEDWPSKTVVQIHILARPRNKCMFVLSQESIASARIKMEMRDYWRSMILELLRNTLKNAP